MLTGASVREVGLRGVPLHRWYLAIGGALLALYLLVPPFQGSPVLINFLSGSSAVAIVVGVRRNRPVTAWPWLLFALGQALFFLGDVYTYLYPKLLGHEVPFPSIGDGLYLAMYPVLMVGVLIIVRRRNPEGDRAGVIDALIITVGVGLLSWFFLMAPYVHDATLSPLAKGVSIAYPLGDVLLLAAVLRLVFDGGRRQGSFYLLVAAVLTLFVTDAAYGYALLDGSYNHQLIYDAGWISYYLLWGSAALNPTMRNLVEPTPDRERRLSRWRLALLTTASVMAPAIEIVREFHTGDVDLLVIMAASMLLFLLVIARVVGLVRQHERAVSRERALRSAGAALVSASTSEEIHAAALATAVSLVDEAGQGAPVPRDPDRCRALHRRRAADRRLRGGRARVGRRLELRRAVGPRLASPARRAGRCGVRDRVPDRRRQSPSRADRGRVVGAVVAADLAGAAVARRQRVARTRQRRADRGHAPARERSALRLARAQRERPHHGRRQRRDHRLPEPVDRAHPRLPPRRGARNLVPGAADRRRSRPAGPAARHAAAWRSRNVHVRVHALSRRRTHDQVRGPRDRPARRRARPRDRAERPRRLGAHGLPGAARPPGVPRSRDEPAEQGALLRPRPARADARRSGARRRSR